jgi:hypothetical protein
VTAAANSAIPSVLSVRRDNFIMNLLVGCCGQSSAVARRLDRGASAMAHRVAQD